MYTDKDSNLINDLRTRYGEDSLRTFRTHRAKTVSSSQDRMDKEFEHIRTALQHCQFPSWALNQWQHKFTHSNQQSNSTTNTSSKNNTTDNNKNKATIVVPYIPNTSEKFKKLCKKKGIQVHFKGTKHSQDSIRKSQGQGPLNKPKRDYIPLLMPPHKLPQCIHRRVRQIFRRQSKRTFQSPSSIHHHMTPHGPQPV